VSANRPVILVVDDSEDMLALMEKALAADYQVLTASDPGSAIEKAGGEPRPDLILLDIEMPEIDGFELCRALKDEPATRAIPVIFLTGKTEAQAQVAGLELGAVDYLTKSGANAAVLRTRVRMHLALADRRVELERLVLERTEQVERTRVELIKRLARVLEFHESQAVGNRVVRLGHYAKLIALASGATPDMAEMLLKAAPLHDIGKIGVPAEILRKREKLSAPDWERIKRHPELGAEIIGKHTDPLLKLARELALTHHENYDGSGYPKGLKGEAIPWGGRVMAMVDAFEAMTSTQFYREALPADRAAVEIQLAAGSKYDPKLVEAFQKALPVILKVRETYADKLGDLINLDFAPKGAAKPAAPPPAPKPKISAADIAKAAAAKKK
jgi:putative two-component system response regulator